MAVRRLHTAMAVCIRVHSVLTSFNMSPSSALSCSLPLSPAQGVGALSLGVPSSATMSTSGRFLLLGFSGGNVQVRPTEVIGRFLPVCLHDGDTGRITAATTSYDDNFLITAGADGGLFVVRSLIGCLEVGNRLFF